LYKPIEAFVVRALILYAACEPFGSKTRKTPLFMLQKQRVTYSYGNDLVLALC
jgi:hypothetical protein